MKKTLLVLLSLAALAAFVGCSNSAGSSGSSGNSSSGGPDLSGVTSGNWTSQYCWIEMTRNGNSTTYGSLETTDPTTSQGNTINGDSNHFWGKATKWTLATTDITKITRIIGYRRNNINVVEGDISPNLTFTTSQQKTTTPPDGLYYWKDASNVYIAYPEHHHTTKQSRDNCRMIFVFDNNSKLELFWGN